MEYVNFLCGGKSIDCQIGGTNITLLIDSGTEDNVIDEIGWEVLNLKNAKIHNFTEKVDKAFTPYDMEKPLPTIGSFMAKLKVADRQIEAKFYVVKVKARCLLGTKTAEKIGVLKVGLDVSNPIKFA